MKTKKRWAVYVTEEIEHEYEVDAATYEDAQGKGLWLLYNGVDGNVFAFEPVAHAIEVDK